MLSIRFKSSLRCIVAATCLSAWSASAEPLNPERALEMGCVDRRNALSRATLDERAALFARLSDDQLVEIGRKSLCEMGSVYRLRLDKQERVKGTLLHPETLLLTVQGEPFAVRADYVDGPAKGRRVLFNSRIRQNELRARDAGLFSVVPLWVDIHGWLALRDTNHPVTDLGIGGFLRCWQDNFSRSRKAGVTRHDAGWDDRGFYCIDYLAPPGSKDVYAARTRMCFDTALALPTAALSTDDSGIVERVEMSQMESSAKVPDGFFTVEGAGL